MPSTELDRPVRAALAMDARSRGLDPSDRFEAAWSAAAERLYGGGAVPDGRSLTSAALAGLNALKNAHAHHHGYARGHRGNGAWSGRGAARYWLAPPAGDSPYEQVEDRVALGQVLAALDPLDRAALVAYADGLPADSARVDRARRCCAELLTEKGDTDGR